MIEYIVAFFEGTRQAFDAAFDATDPNNLAAFL